jgi:methionine synthase I (cobalamin-dependent)
LSANLVFHFLGGFEMAQRPNEFDKKFEKSMEKTTAEESLALIAKDSKIVQAVKDALTSHDKDSMVHGKVGPTRTQAIRKALVEALEA